MARSAKKPTFTTPSWRQALKTHFLHFAFRHNPEALRQLATKVRSKRLTPREWANSFGVAETWIEEWAADTIETWRIQPYLISDSDQTNSLEPKEILYPPPREEKTADDVFSFSVTSVPTCKLSLGATAAGSFPDGEPEDDWCRFRKQMHARLDDALDWYHQNALTLGASREVVVPNKLLQKVEITAVYFFVGRSAEQMLPLLTERVSERTTVHRWIKEVAALLDLTTKARRDKRSILVAPNAH